MIKQFGSVLVLAFGMFAVSGCCAGAKKVKECSELIKTIGEGQQKAKAVNPSVSNPASFGKFGDAYDEAGQKVAKLDISTPEIKAEQADYVAMTKEVSKAFHDVSSKPKGTDVKSELDKAVAHENAVVDKINKTCGLK